MRKNASLAWPSNSLKRSIFFNRDFSYHGGGIPGLEVKNYTPPLKILKRHPWLENGPLLACGSLQRSDGLDFFIQQADKSSPVHLGTLV